MATNHAERREFLRYVYESADDSSHPAVAGLTSLGTEEARHVVISWWRQSAIEDIGRGKALTNASGQGKTAGYTPSSASAAMELASWARDHVSEGDLATAIAAIQGPITSYASDYRFLCV